MRALVIGLGSIGARHARNLLTLGHEVVGFDPDPARRAVPGATPVADLAHGFAAGCDFAVVASPNRFHLEQSLAAARSGLHLFVEKPLAAGGEGLAALLSETSQRRLCAMVGSNWKFHPLLVQAKALLDAGEIGAPLAVQAVGGQYLPDWHPWEDYRRGYSARSDLGGGALLDSHELDLLAWLIGPVAAVNCREVRTGTLEIDTEDLVCMTLEFLNGALGTLQLDYLQRPYGRRVHLTGSKGTLIWNALENELALFTAAGGHWHRWRTPLSYDINQMYVDEMRHFADCIGSQGETRTSLRQAAHVVAVFDAARASAARGGATQEVAT